MPIRRVDLGSVEHFMEQLHEVETSAELTRLFHETVTSFGYVYFDYHVLLSAAMDHGSSRMTFGLTSQPEGRLPPHGMKSAAEAPAAEETLPARLAESREATMIPLLSRHGECAEMILVHQTGPHSAPPVMTGLIQLVADFFHAHALRRLLREEMLRHSSRRTSVLSVRERETMGWVASGKSSWEIAQILGIARKSVDFYVESTRRKLQASNRTHAVVKAVMLGLIGETITRTLPSGQQTEFSRTRDRLDDVYRLVT